MMRAPVFRGTSSKLTHLFPHLFSGVARTQPLPYPYPTTGAPAGVDVSGRPHDAPARLFRPSEARRSDHHPLLPFCYPFATLAATFLQVSARTLAVPSAFLNPRGPARDVHPPGPCHSLPSSEPTP